jgi:hypothetical protein
MDVRLKSDDVSRRRRHVWMNNVHPHMFKSKMCVDQAVDHNDFIDLFRSLGFCAG